MEVPPMRVSLIGVSLMRVPLKGVEFLQIVMSSEMRVFPNRVPSMSSEMRLSSNGVFLMSSKMRVPPMSLEKRVPSMGVKFLQTEFLQMEFL
jgi:hypothetical protein